MAEELKEMTAEELLKMEKNGTMKKEHPEMNEEIGTSGKEENK